MDRLETFLGKIALEGNIRVLALQTLVSQLGFGMFYVIWQPFILSTGASVADLGVIQSAINLVTAGGLILWGVLSDRLGRKPMLMLGWVMGVTSITGFIFSRRFEFFLLFYAVSALDMNFYLSAWMPLVSERAPPESLSTVLGKLDSYSRLAGIPAPWLGGMLYTLYGFRAPLLVHLGFIFVYGALIISIRER